MLPRAAITLGAQRAFATQTTRPGQAAPTEVRVNTVENTAVVDLLGVLAYAELTAFDRLAEDARLAPSLSGHAALAGMAAAEIDHHGRLVATGWPSWAPSRNRRWLPSCAALDAFHESTRPRTWLEGLVKAYVGDGLAADFYREIAEFLPGPTAPWSRRCWPTPATPTSPSARCAPRSPPTARSAGRLALWARRLVGEAITRSQAVIAERDELGRLIIDGMGDFAGVGRLIDRITSAHSVRMRALGLRD